MIIIMTVYSLTIGGVPKSSDRLFGSCRIMKLFQDRRWNFISTVSNLVIRDNTNVFNRKKVGSI